MGAWSHEPFGNDEANDWAYDLEDTTDLALIEEALDTALGADEYLEAPEATVAVAAVEVIAKLLGKGTQADAYTEKVDEWVKTISVRPSPQLLAKARRVLDRVAGEDSELRELWEEDEQWQASIHALRSAVNG